MQTKDNLTPDQIKRLRDLAEMPDEDIDYSDIPPTEWTGKGVVGLYTLPPDEYEEAMAYLRAEHEKMRENPPPPPTSAPPRKIRYTREDIDTTIRHCAKETPDDKICGAPFRVSDYPVGYYPFKDQVQKGSYIDTCPICEIKRLKYLLEKPDDEYSRLSLEADLELLENHISARLDA